MAKVIVIHGPSSSGKTSIAKELQTSLAEKYHYLSNDEFTQRFSAASPQILNELDQAKLPEYFEIMKVRFGKVFHGVVKCFAVSGINVIVDHVLSNDTALNDFVELLADHESYFIGLNCSLEELERRELQRGDRKVGLAKHHFRSLSFIDIFDFVLDTTSLSSQESSIAIKQFLEEGNKPVAFSEIKKRIDQSLLSKI